MQYLEGSYTDDLDINNPNLSDEEIKKCKQLIENKLIKEKEVELKKIQEAAEYIGVSVEEYFLIMNKNI